MSQPTSRSETDSETAEEGLFPLSGGPTAYRTGFYVAVLVYVAYLLVTALGFSADDRLFPYLVGVPTIVFTLLQILFVQYPGLEQRFSTENESSDIKAMFEDAQESEAGRSRAERQKYELLMIAWVVALPILIYYLGLATALPIYVFAFIWFFTRDPKFSLVITLGFSVGAYVLFIVTLGLIPWEGVLNIPSPLDFVPRIQLPI